MNSNFKTYLLSFLLNLFFTAPTYISTFPNTAQEPLHNFFVTSLHNFTDHTLSKSLESLIWGNFLSSGHFGALLGVIITSITNRKFGRKCLLLLIICFGAPGYLAQFLAKYLPKNWGWLVMFGGRIISTVAIGIRNVIMPVFLSEISPVDIRGSIGMTYR